MPVQKLHRVVCSRIGSHSEYVGNAVIGIKGFKNEVIKVGELFGKPRIHGTESSHPAHKIDRCGFISSSRARTETCTGSEVVLED